MMKNRQQLLTLLALTVVGLWAGDKLVLTPLVKSWRERSAGIADLRKKIRDGRQLLARENVLRDRWDTMRANTLTNEVSAAENQVFKAFDGWSRESRVSVSGVVPQWKRGEEEYVTLDCRVDAFGSLGAVTRFLYEIEKDPLALRLDSVELTSRDNTGSQITLGLQVSGLQLIEKTP